MREARLLRAEGRGKVLLLRLWSVNAVFLSVGLVTSTPAPLRSMRVPVVVCLLCRSSQPVLVQVVVRLLCRSCQSVLVRQSWAVALALAKLRIGATPPAV